MKKLVMIATMMMAVVCANAQFAPGTISIQPKLGLGASTLTNIDDNDPTAAGLIGVEFESQVKNWLGISIGADFQLVGTGYEDISNITTDRRTDLGYIAIPAMANFYVVKGLALKAGLQPGFLVHAKEHFKKNGTKFDNDVKDGCEKFDLAIPIGISYQFPIPIVLDTRFIFGTSNVFKDTSKTYSNVTFMISVGYKFAL